MGRFNLQIKVGTYTGNGSDNRSITGVGFKPDFVLIKGGAQNAVFRTKAILADQSSYFSNNAAVLANAIQGFLSDGFQVGNDNTVNGGTIVYHYLAIRATDTQAYFKSGRYFGDGANDRNLTASGINFTPDLVVTKRDGASFGVFRTSTMVGDSSAQFGTVANAADLIQSLISNGFQLGTSDLVNNNASYYNFFALRALAGIFAVGSYAGDGTDDRNITGVGFQPDFVFMKASTNVHRAVLKFSTQEGEPTFDFANTGPNATNFIQSFLADGFQVGSGNGVNASTGSPTYHWAAIKAGDYSVPIVRTAV